MKLYPDAIFIGAINYDYIFQSKNKGEDKHSPDSGKEKLNWDIKNGPFDDKIQELYENYDIKSRQLGGSAFLALRAFKAVDPTLHAAYVGTCGYMNIQDLKRGGVVQDKDFDMIDNKDWFFDYHNSDSKIEDNIIGRSYVILDKNSTRGNIEIDPGINNKLLYFIKQKESQGADFTDFLSKTRWIHISSLSAFDDFLEIIQYIRDAKQRNPFLIVSADLGDEYTSGKRRQLLEKHVFEVFNFIFLSNQEKMNLLVNPKGRREKKNDNLKLLFQANGLTIQQILVVKQKNKYELYNNINGQISVIRFWQQKLTASSIVNDTGAGDFFAGGFIGGMLSAKFLPHQPMPIDLGSIVAKEMLKSNSIEDACKKANSEVDKYMKEIYQNEELNIGQLIKIKWEKVKNAWIFSIIVSFILGIITTLIV